MENCNLCLDCGLPCFTRPWLAVQYEERAWEVILLTEDLEVITPCGGALVAHHEDVFGELVDSCSRICPDVVEENKRVNVQLGFNWKLS